MRREMPDSPPTHVWIKDIRENDAVDGCYLVREKRVGTTRRGDAFISLLLADRSGELEGRVWDGADRLSSLFQEGDLIEVKGTAGSYRGQVQVTVSDLKVHEGPVVPERFLESAPVDSSEMVSALKKILEQIRNVHLKALVNRFLGDPAFVSSLRKAPAAKNFHHNYLGGLLEHTLSVCRLVQKVTDHYPQLDRDLILTGAFLHDIGKLRELRYDLHIDYTDEGRLVGHLVLGTAMLDEKIREVKGFPEALGVRLKHLMISHHGVHEFGSPKRPKFLEAFALNLIDDLDAKMNGLARFMARDGQEGAWTEFNRMFERFFLKGEILPSENEGPDEGDAEDQQGSLFSSS
jgi:3'-5' exoribonuclease